MLPLKRRRNGSIDCSSVYSYDIHSMSMVYEVGRELMVWDILIDNCR